MTLKIIKWRKHDVDHPGTELPNRHIKGGESVLRDGRGVPFGSETKPLLRIVDTILDDDKFVVEAKAGKNTEVYKWGEGFEDKDHLPARHGPASGFVAPSEAVLEIMSQDRFGQSRLNDGWQVESAAAGKQRGIILTLDQVKRGLDGLLPKWEVPGTSDSRKYTRVYDRLEMCVSLQMTDQEIADALWADRSTVSKDIRVWVAKIWKYLAENPEKDVNGGF